jgi:acyl-CoA synthetase (NDP forming)
MVTDRIVASAAEAAAAADEAGGNVAMKIASPDILHKTEAGGVMLDIAAENAAVAFDAILSRAVLNAS